MILRILLVLGGIACAGTVAAQHSNTPTPTQAPVLSPMEPAIPPIEPASPSKEPVLPALEPARPSMEPAAPSTDPAIPAPSSDQEPDRVPLRERRRQAPPQSP